MKWGRRAGTHLGDAADDVWVLPCVVLLVSAEDLHLPTFQYVDLGEREVSAPEDLSSSLTYLQLQKLLEAPEKKPEQRKLADLLRLNSISPFPTCPSVFVALPPGLCDHMSLPLPVLSVRRTYTRR